MPVKLQRRFECDMCGEVSDVWVAPGVPDHLAAPEGWQVRPLDPGEPYKVFCASASCVKAYESQAEGARKARLKRREEARASQADRVKARNARKAARRDRGDES